MVLPLLPLAGLAPPAPSAAAIASPTNKLRGLRVQDRLCSACAPLCCCCLRGGCAVAKHIAALLCRSQYDIRAADGPLSIVGVGSGRKPLDICRPGRGGGGRRDSTKKK